MKRTTNTTLTSRGRLATLFSAIAAMLCVASGCSKDEKEKEPVVSVQTSPARRASISQVISAEAVVSPLPQTTLAPHLPSPIRTLFPPPPPPPKKRHFLA